MTTRTSQTLTRTRTRLKIALTPLRHAWLSAMGIEVPWIKPDQTVAEPLATSVIRSPSVEVTGRLAEQGPSLSMSQTPASESIHPTQAKQPSQLPSPRSSGPQSVKSIVRSPIGAITPVGSPAIVARRDLTGLSMDELASEIKQCQLCGLCSARSHAVAGQGVSSPEIMVIGEAPGEQEDLEGLPFVGRSGQLLDNMLRAIGHDRTRTVFITNVVKCRPPANRNPKDEEISACQPYLQRQIELLKPKLILAMGRFAAHTLLDTDAALQNLRQQNLSITAQDRTIPVVVTYHPSYLLRRPVDKHLAWEDLKRVRQTLTLI